MDTSALVKTPHLLRSRREARVMLGGISQTTLDALLNQGLLQRVKVGRRAMVTDQSIRGFIADRTNKG